MSNWTQPLCIPCWNRENPDRQTAGHGDVGDLEHCCQCGDATRSGIYVRRDPATVPFPTDGED